MSSTSPIAGAAASRAWLDSAGLDDRGEAHWYVEITLSSDEPGTRFELNIYPEEWGFVLRVGARVSSIRVTDVAFVHGADDHLLLRAVPPLDAIRGFLRRLEDRFGVQFERHAAEVRSNLVRAGALVKPWLVSG